MRKEILWGCQVIRHQMTGAGLHTLSFRGPEAKSRYLPTLHRLLQAVKSACRVARGCEELIYISSKALFMLLFLVNDRRRSTSIVISNGVACQHHDKGLRAL